MNLKKNMIDENKVSKVIFLDFDGVITTLKSNWTIDNEKVELVNRFAMRPEPK